MSKSSDAIIDSIKNEARRAVGKAPVPTGPQKDTIRPSDDSRGYWKDAFDKDFDIGYTAKKMKAEREAANAAANRKEAEAEGQKYAKGGKVTGYRGYGKAKKV